LPKIAIGVEYLGSNFYGFQKQKVVRTVQGELEKALSQVADEKITTICAGRTDAGVHAHEQVVHFTTTKIRENRAWLFGTNRFLPSDINLVWVREVSKNFHARFDAFARRYNYLIYNSPVRSALKKDSHLWEPRKLNIENMQQACEHLIGKHDFACFQDSQCQAKSSIKIIEFLTITTKGQEILIDIKANAFLHHMVRNIVGTLLKIGYGDKPTHWMLEVLNSKDRKQAGITAPAHGLYFIQAFYPNLV
jgi:tRNA pseudouridine38-40 synthase